jgi:hypothetical protein
MAESCWTASVVTQEHLQNLMSHEYMTAVELATCHVPDGPACSAPMGGYVVVCVVFYERANSVPSH